MADFLDLLMSNAEKEFGKKGVYAASEQEKRTFGLEHYSIALQFLMDSQVIPLQSIITLAGMAKTYKTSALLEISKMFVSPPINGRSIFINTEGKMSSTKIWSIVREFEDNIKMAPASSIQEWQQRASFFLTQIKDAQEKIASCKASKGKKDQAYKDMSIPPIVICVDSLTGAQSDSMIEQVIKEGQAPGKTFQDRAGLITQWLNTWGSQIIGLPVLVLMSNHLKDNVGGMAGPGGPGKSTPGGVAPAFHTSLEIRVSRIKDIDKAGYEGAELQWKTHYSSIGQDKRKINIPYYETYNEENKQIAWYGWDEALCRLIVELQEEGSRFKELKEYCGMREIPKTGYGKVYTCNCLDIDSKRATDEIMTGEVVGKMLQTNPEIRAKLRSILHITPHQVWTPDLELEI